MKDKIVEIINEKLFDLVDLGPPKRTLGGIDAAAEAIAELVEEQPVSKVRAMAALVRQDHPFGDYYDVPGDNGVFYQVDKKTLSQCWNRHTLVLCSRGDCDHIQAVRLNLAAQETTRS